MTEKACLVGPAYPFRGGIAHFTALLAGEFAKDHDVLVINFKRLYPSFLFPGKTQFDESKAPFSIESVRTIDSLNPISFWKTAKTIARFEPDLVVLCYNLNDPVDFSGELGYFFRREAQGRLLRFGGYRTGYWLGRSRFLGWLSYRIEKLLVVDEHKQVSGFGEIDLGCQKRR